MPTAVLESLCADRLMEYLGSWKFVRSRCLHALPLPCYAEAQGISAGMSACRSHIREVGSTLQHFTSQIALALPVCSIQRLDMSTSLHMPQPVNTTVFVLASIRLQCGGILLELVGHADTCIVPHSHAAKCQCTKSLYFEGHKMSDKDSRHSISESVTVSDET